MARPRARYRRRTFAIRHCDVPPPVSPHAQHGLSESCNSSATRRGPHLSCKSLPMSFLETPPVSRASPRPVRFEDNARIGADAEADDSSGLCDYDAARAHSNQEDAMSSAGEGFRGRTGRVGRAISSAILSIGLLAPCATEHGRGAGAPQGRHRVHAGRATARGARVPRRRRARRRRGARRLLLAPVADDRGWSLPADPVRGEDAARTGSSSRPSGSSRASSCPRDA